MTPRRPGSAAWLDIGLWGLWGLWWLGAVVFPAIGSAKPQAPIELRLSATPSTHEGRVAEVTLHVRPLVDAPKIRVAFVLPEGVALIDGDDVWEGTLTGGESRDVRISVRAPDREAYVIIGSATIHYPDGTRLGGSAAVTVRSR